MEDMATASVCAEKATAPGKASRDADDVTAVGGSTAYMADKRVPSVWRGNDDQESVVCDGIFKGAGCILHMARKGQDCAPGERAGAKRAAANDIVQTRTWLASMAREGM